MRRIVPLIQTSRQNREKSLELDSGGLVSIDTQAYAKEKHF
jgi:hypothetical protein